MQSRSSSQFLVCHISRSSPHHEGYCHLAFSFVSLFGKWQIINTNCSFLEENLAGLVLLIKISPEGNVLLQYMAFPSIV